jgi:hypothetical protein
VRIGASHSKYKIDSEATKVIHSILFFSPAPESVAVEIPGISHLGECSLLIPKEFIDSPSEQSIVRRTFQSDPTTWALDKRL